MIETYQVWLDDPYGTRIAALDRLTSLSIVRGVQSAAWSVTLPGDFDRRIVNRDQLIEIWRKPYMSNQPQLLRVGMVKNIRQEENDAGVGALIIGGPDARAILRSRIVAYAAGSSQATKTDYADDMMKAIVRENLGSSAVANRDLSAYGISVAGDVSKGPLISKVFGWKNVETVLDDISAASAQAGTGLYYDMRPQPLSSGKIGFVFETSTNQPGMDRSGSVYFGKTWANLSQPVLTEDYTDEASYIYAGGRGLEISDTERTKASIWGRKEIYLDTKSETATTIMTGMANEELALKKGKKQFGARLIDTESCRYGVEWNFGDRVTVQAFDEEYSGVIRAVQINVSNAGERLEARIELDTA